MNGAPHDRRLQELQVSISHEIQGCVGVQRLGCTASGNEGVQMKDNLTLSASARFLNRQRTGAVWGHRCGQSLACGLPACAHGEWGRQKEEQRKFDHLKSLGCSGSAGLQSSAAHRDDASQHPTSAIKNMACAGQGYER